MYSWKTCPNAPIRNALKMQSKDVNGEFEQRTNQVTVTLSSVFSIKQLNSSPVFICGLPGAPLNLKCMNSYQHKLLGSVVRLAGCVFWYCFMKFS